MPIHRPAPLSEERLQELPEGTLSLRLKRPWSDGTTHLLFSPGELIEKLIPLVPRPRAHITRYHGVLAPASGWRAEVVPAAAARRTTVEKKPQPAEARGKWIPWADLLQRVFLTDALACPRCGGRMRIVAAVLASDPVRAILAHARLPTGPPPGCAGKSAVGQFARRNRIGVLRRSTRPRRRVRVNSLWSPRVLGIRPPGMPD